MDLEERFRKLADLKRMVKEETNKVRGEKITELRNKYRIYVPRVDKLCSKFAKGVGWGYRGPDKKNEKGITETYDDIIHFPIRGYDPKCEFTVILELGSGRCFLKSESLWGTGDSPSGWGKSEFVCDIISFTEEKLANILEDLFKDLLRYLYKG